MSLNKIKAFVTAVEYGSLTKAAKKLDYTQPSISHMISSLEDEYGFSLLIRGKSGVSPTDNGLVLLPIMQDLLKRAQRLAETINEINGMEVGRIRIGAYTSVCVHWMPTVLSLFNKKFPKIQIQLYEGNSQEIKQWLENGKIDFGIGTTQIIQNSNFIPLKNDRMLAILPNHHILANHHLIELKTFATEPCIMPYEDSHHDVQFIFKKEKISPNIAYQIRGDEAIIAMVKKGLGISLLSELLIKEHLPEICAKPIEGNYIRTIGILTNSSVQSLSPSSKKFIPFLQEWVQKNG
ncbi:LysR family transcriptional regulator [Rummeliibacillus pycnus]|uniref:LysR family transcriptional regulator n=1 Tax=Rummeliibacillus pycnus TaxID=101070 RepID=UPI000C9C6D5C|nr:LysR family transcriptional regulator [Rummeliibacillus pycnus]